jgi:glutamate--cysteine ligase
MHLRHFIMPPLKQANLRNFLERGHRPRTDWKLGVEYEQFVTDLDGYPVPYLGADGVRGILHDLVKRTGWKPISEGEYIFGLQAPDGRAITIEPGAQIEFGSTPCSSLEQVATEISGYVALLDEIKQQRDIQFLAVGAQPLVRPEQIQRIPKARYDILEPYLQSTGDLGVWMMKATCGVQINFDHSDEADAMHKMRTMFRLSPLLSAMFANSSICAGENSGFASWRGHVWSRTDPARCGLVPSLMSAESCFQDYIDWALDMSMLFIYREGKCLDMRGTTFRQHLQRGDATEADWELHLSTPFPEVRFRPQLELRCTDSLCPTMTLALAALIKGVFYQQDALQQAWELCADWSMVELQQTWLDAHQHGLAAAIPEAQQNPQRRTLLDMARELVDLCVLTPSDAQYLAPLMDLLEDGRSEGELAADLFDGEWNGSMQKLAEFARCSEIDATAAGN